VGTQRRNGLEPATPTGPQRSALNDTGSSMSQDWEWGYDDGEVASWTVWVSPNFPVSNGAASERLTSP
jgi:hypothetical protein